MGMKESITRATNLLEFNIDDCSLKEFTTSYFHSSTTKCSKAHKLSSHAERQILDILESNMKPLYLDSKVKWSLDQKRDEMTFHNMRFLVCAERSSNQIVGFSTFMFDEEDGEAVLYLYELQVRGKNRKQGIATHLMSLVEDIALTTGMSHVVLTVFLKNTVAMSMYVKRGYKPHYPDRGIYCDEIMSRSCQ
ncbi:NAA40 [Acrasis kona]|uniref:N-alpha-acetyltransferase 40 n=1 Tax=Acrasis kona TaxID=1008807 RepID=A0AAW2YHQ9_9EUKA